MSDDNARPLTVGDRIHGYCGGYFDRDHYDCGTVEAVGKDWLVARSTRGAAYSATGRGILTTLAEYRDNESCAFYSGGEDNYGCRCTFYDAEWSADDDG